VKRFAVLLFLAFALTFCSQAQIKPGEPITVQSTQEYTYEGELDPAELIEWEEVGEAILWPTGTRFVVIKNPDPLASIQYVYRRTSAFLFLNDKALVTGYAYIKDAELYVYEERSLVGDETYRYERVQVTFEEEVYIKEQLSPYVKKSQKCS